MLVTHRLPSVVDCDQIFVMGEGRIVESGTHEELLTRRGAYAEMWGGAEPAEEAEPSPPQTLPRAARSRWGGLRWIGGRA